MIVPWNRSNTHCGQRRGLTILEQLRSFVLESADRESLNLDGEMKRAAPVLAEVLPAALRVFGTGRN
jgi:diacylglycerol kinase family enzyme